MMLKVAVSGKSTQTVEENVREGFLGSQAVLSETWKSSGKDVGTVRCVYVFGGQDVSGG